MRALETSIKAHQRSKKSSAEECVALEAAPEIPSPADPRRISPAPRCGRTRDSLEARPARLSNPDDKSDATRGNTSARFIILLFSPPPPGVKRAHSSSTLARNYASLEMCGNLLLFQRPRGNLIKPVKWEAKVPRLRVSAAATHFYELRAVTTSSFSCVFSIYTRRGGGKNSIFKPTKSQSWSLGHTANSRSPRGT